MLIIDFQPGDGTLYHVGAEPVSAESAKRLGFGQEKCILFFFGTSSWECAGVIPVRSLLPSDFHRLNLVGWTAQAACIVHSYLTETELYLSRVENVLQRWEDAPRDQYTYWQDQLEIIQAQLKEQI